MKFIRVLKASSTTPTLSWDGHDYIGIYILRDVKKNYKNGKYNFRGIEKDFKNFHVNFNYINGMHNEPINFEFEYHHGDTRSETLQNKKLCKQEAIDIRNFIKTRPYSSLLSIKTENWDEQFIVSCYIKDDKKSVEQWVNLFGDKILEKSDNTED